jgi:hypothetical protein
MYMCVSVCVRVCAFVYAQLRQKKKHPSDPTTEKNEKIKYLRANGRMGLTGKHAARLAKNVFSYFAFETPPLRMFYKNKNVWPGLGDFVSHPNMQPAVRELIAAFWWY